MPPSRVAFATWDHVQPCILEDLLGTSLASRYNVWDIRRGESDEGEGYPRVYVWRQSREHDDERTFLVM